MDTTQRILTTAERLIQHRGYSGFSFQDIANEVGIRKPSIYHHFASKSDLGRAVIEAYRKRMREVAERLHGHDEIDAETALKQYLQPILEVGRSPGGACLCGVLGGEYPHLPAEMQTEVQQFFSEHLDFLESLFERGKSAGTFQFSLKPRAMAELAFAAIEGSMIIKRSINDMALTDDVAGSILGLLKA